MANTVMIVDHINLGAISSLTLLMKKYPILEDILRNNKSKSPADDWDYFMIAAGLGLVLHSPETYKDEHKKEKERAIEIYKDISRATDDFIAFLSKEKVEDSYLPTIVGLWVLWNVKQEEPSYNEMKNLAPAIGNILFNTIRALRKERKVLKR